MFYTAFRAASRGVPRRYSTRTYSLNLLPRTLAPLSSSSSFHTSARRYDELPKSPFKTFVEVLQEEIRKNRQLEENVLKLQGDVTKMQDSEAMKRAKDMYERARLTASIKENPRLRVAAEQLRASGVKVGDAVSEALKTMEESDIMRAISRASNAVSSTIVSGTEPIRNTAAYKALAETVIDALDDSGSSKHAGYETKEVRRLRRKRRLERAGRSGTLSPRPRTTENSEAGSNIVLHKDNAKREKWERLKETNPVFRRLADLRRAYVESEDPLVAGMRSVTSTIGRWFDENETAQVTRLMKAMDPNFNVESFGRELREFIIPEVVDAYISADKEALSAWCSEATFNVLWATMEVYLKQGLVPESQVLDIRNVDVSQGKLLENDVPVFVVSFSTQEVLVFRNSLSREVVVGAPDKVEQVMYAAIITRLESELEDELTGGWKIIEMARRGGRSYL
ncbi:uncharacterized protein EI90DRAFT_3062857 [Cantharellus anzutake]|uniref:uncharacterized protein n=1 Tax=Cantharellus anzutake TaxID=1750568 RepID=UPI001903DAC7|nr:uncharacterized protein EI90DRAFT_3062857 [Cantharellus anzutake]KAF8329512.1 hypothetical protein EI90DRAFT_3062857 [Cantharellus anzutake]